MSMDPQMMAQLLMRQGQQPQGAPGQAGLLNTSSGAPNLLQQVLTSMALKQRLGQQPPPTNPGTPGAQMGPGGLHPNGWMPQQ